MRQHTAFLAYLFPLYAIAALTTLVAALIRGVPLMQPWPILALCLLMALGPQLVGHGSLNYAVRYLPAALLGLLSLMEPIGASLFAYGLFGEVPPLLALVGMGIVLGAVAVAFTGRRSGPPEDH